MILTNELNRLIEIVETLKLLRDKTGLEITPDALLTNARALFISEQIAQQRGDKQGFKPFVKQSQDFFSETPATAKQLSFMNSLGITARQGITKREAFLLIKEKQNNE